MTTAKPLLDVLAGKVPRRRPVWLMRQAGRYLPEYRKVRGEAGSFLDLCYRPELAAEVTLQPLRRFDLDAAILFADILLLPQALGADLAFKENEGPVLSRISDMAGVARLDRTRAADHLSPVMETVRRVKAELPGHVALIGFCGAPWTVASYMIEGGGSDERLLARRAALEGQDWFRALMDMIIASSVDYLAAQVEAGAEAVQIFDSWAGDLAADQVPELVLDPIRRIIEGLRLKVGPVPVICFARGIGAGHLEAARVTGANALGLEQSVPVGWAAKHLTPVTAVQGNLDPLRLAIGGKALTRAVAEICASLPRHSHIFNLGHGVRQETPPDHVAELVAAVRAADGA